MKNFISKTVISIILLSYSSTIAQTYPFPQNIKYKYGYMSAHIKHTDAEKVYAYWKATFVRYCGDNEAHVIKSLKGVETTVSEGIGYGLAIAAYAGDKVLFDKLLNYFNARTNTHGMMNWIYENCDGGDNKKNGATDAELDAAFAFVVAHKQWPDDERYHVKASKLIDSIQKYYFTICNDVIVQKPGDYFGGCTCTNPSYYAPGYYRVFAKFKEAEKNIKAKDFWNKAAEDAYIPLLKNAHPYTGLVFAWANAEGGNPSDCFYEVAGSGTFNTYQYDACRTPWRIATDYIWWGNSQAEVWTKKIVNFVKSPIYKQVEVDGAIWYGAGGVENVVDNYYHNGLRRINPDEPTWGHRHTMPFVGAFALAAMCSNQEDTDVFMKDLQTVTPINYYESCLGVLYLFMATGNFWNPY